MGVRCSKCGATIKAKFIRCSRCGALILVKFEKEEIVFYDQPSLSQLLRLHDEWFGIHPCSQASLRQRFSKNEEIEKE